MKFLFYFADEQEMYQDILQEDFIDSYNNLTLKSVTTLKYYANLKQDKLLLLKTDDDSYVHIGKIFFHFSKFIYEPYENCIPNKRLPLP